MKNLFLELLCIHTSEAEHCLTLITCLFVKFKKKKTRCRGQQKSYKCLQIYQMICLIIGM